MNILIIGASGDMGQAIYKTLSVGEHTFFLHFHSSKKMITKKNDYPLQADLELASDLVKLVDFILQKGGVDVIIHSASLPTPMAPITDKSWKTFESHFKVQVGSLFFLSKHLLPIMKQKKFGRIIALATEYTIGRPPTKLADYVTAKYALVGLIKSLAVELGPYGITANCISSGLSETKLTSHLPKSFKKIIADQTPQKSLAAPQDIAALVKFLSSAQAGMITGENIIVNGGYVMR